MTLPVVVPFHDDEVALDLPSRLAHANGYSSVRRLVEAAGIKLTDLAKGEEAAIGRLAKWSGIEPERLSKFAQRTTGRTRSWKLGEAVFDKDARTGHRYRYCPACVAGDIGVGGGRPGALTYTRAAWMTRSIRTCTIHCQPIVETPYSETLGRDFSRYVTENSAEIFDQADLAIKASGPSSFDIYLNERIFGIERGGYLDQFQAYVIAILCTFLGKLFAQYRAGLAEFAGVPWDLGDADVGFYFASQGEAVIRSAMAIVLRTYWLKVAGKMPFGRLALWLRRNRDSPDFVTLVELFQDITERNLPWAPGELGVVHARHRYIHRLLSASNEFNMTRARVLQLAESAGLVAHPLPPLNKLLFDAEKLNAVLRPASETLSAKDAQSRLGVSEAVMSRIVKSGMLEVTEQKDIRTVARIRDEDLVKFQTGLFSGARLVTCVDDDLFVSVKTAVKKCFCTYADVIALIHNGSLRNVGALPDHEFRLSHLLVDPREVITVVADKRLKVERMEDAGGKVNRATPPKSIAERPCGIPSGLMSNRQAGRMLRVSSPTIRYLADNGHIVVIVERNMLTTHFQNYLAVASVERFAREHISIADLAAQLETSPIVIERMLSKQGIKPIYEKRSPEDRVARYYRQSELAPLNIFSLRTR